MAANEFLNKFYDERYRGSWIWRYMGLNRFLDLINSRSIWFARADKFDDFFEGSISEATQLAMPYGPDVTSDMVEQFKRIHIWWKQWTFVSCWHQASEENALMWSAHAKTGVAIRTSYARLADHLPNSAVLAPVMYKNYANQVVPEGEYIRYFVKRHFFKDEREVRAVIIDVPEYARTTTGSGMASENLDVVNTLSGLSIPVDLSNLLDAVVCRPFAPPPEVLMVKSACRDAGLSVPVLESQLSGAPILA